MQGTNQSRPSADRRADRGGVHCVRCVEHCAEPCVWDDGRPRHASAARDYYCRSADLVRSDVAERTVQLVCDAADPAALRRRRGGIHHDAGRFVALRQLSQAPTQPHSCGVLCVHSHWFRARIHRQLSNRATPQLEVGVLRCRTSGRPLLSASALRRATPGRPGSCDRRRCRGRGCRRRSSERSQRRVSRTSGPQLLVGRDVGEPSRDLHFCPVHVRINRLHFRASGHGSGFGLAQLVCSEILRTHTWQGWHRRWRNACCRRARWHARWRRDRKPAQQGHGQTAAASVLCVGGGCHGVCGAVAVGGKEHVRGVFAALCCDVHVLVHERSCWRVDEQLPPPRRSLAGQRLQDSPYARLWRRNLATHRRRHLRPHARGPAPRNAAHSRELLCVLGYLARWLVCHRAQTHAAVVRASSGHLHIGWRIACSAFVRFLRGRRWHGLPHISFFNIAPSRNAFPPVRPAKAKAEAEEEQPELGLFFACNSHSR